MLTRKQHELLTYIARQLGKTGISPSFEEMKEALGLKSKSGVHRLITALEERGFIRRLAHRARALEVIKMPVQQTAQKTARQSGGLGANVIQTDFKTRQTAAIAPPESSEATESPESSEAIGSMEVPLYGRIAAGTPIEALQNDLGSIPVPLSMVHGGEYYALEIAGDSMIDAGILDGDTAIIKRCDTAENGTIVVALIDKEEATLKRIRRRGNSVALEAANDAYETRIFGPDRVDIQGRLTGIIRQY